VAAVFFAFPRRVEQQHQEQTAILLSSVHTDRPPGVGGKFPFPVNFLNPQKSDVKCSVALGLGGFPQNVLLPAGATHPIRKNTNGGKLL
jgi:hypothetical protein